MPGLRNGIIGLLIFGGGTSLLTFIYFYAINKFFAGIFDSAIEFFIGTLPYFLVGILGISSTIVAIIWSRQNQRRQDTLRTLLDSRLSPHHGRLLILARNYLRASGDTINNPVKGDGHKDDSSEGALATQDVLNYFDFLSAGILLKNLDEAMLYKTIRGMLCRVVYDARYIIQYYRVTEKQDKVYENLIAVYTAWANDRERERDFNLGQVIPFKSRYKNRP